MYEDKDYQVSQTCPQAYYYVPPGFMTSVGAQASPGHCPQHLCELGTQAAIADFILCALYERMTEKLANAGSRVAWTEDEDTGG